MGSHWREWAYIALIVMAVWGLHGMRRVFWAFSLLMLPGTLAHETCHLVSGFLLRGGPVGFSLLPRREGRGWVLGSVSFNRLTWYNRFFIGMAPLLLLPAAYFLVVWRMEGAPALGWREALAVYLIANLIYAALPSWQDVTIAAKTPVGWVLLAAALAWGWHAWRAPSIPAAAGAGSTGSKAPARPPSPGGPGPG